MAQPNDEFARNAGDSPENMPALRARVPEHVARGEISTGVIVVTGSTEFLLDFVKWKQTPLEKSEKLEQLRALEHGAKIRIITTKAAGPGVDTAENAKEAAKLLAGGKRKP